MTEQIKSAKKQMYCAKDKNAKFIEGFEELYLATRDGRIFSMSKGDFLKPTINDDGYCYVSLSKDGHSKKYTVHRLIAETFIPNTKNRETINHKDGNKENNSVSNLEWLTPKENLQHAVINGLNKYHKPYCQRIMIVETKQCFESIKECACFVNGCVDGIKRAIKRNRNYHGYHYEMLDAIDIINQKLEIGEKADDR